MTQITQGRALDDVTHDAGHERATIGARRELDFGLRRMLAAADCVALLATLAFAMVVVAHDGATPERLALALLALPPWLMLLKLYGLYERDSKRVSHSTLDDIPHIFHALLLASLGLWLLYKLAAPDQRLILGESAVFFVAAMVTVPLARAGARSLAARSARPERVLILGGGPMTRVLVRKIRAHREYALDPIGYVDAAPARDGERFGLPYLGTIDDLDDVCRTTETERLLAVAGAIDHERLADVVRQMRVLKVRVSLVPDLVDVLGPSVEIDDIEGITVLGINPPVLNRSSRMLKRIMDVSVAAVVLLLSAPVLIGAAIAVKRSSPGPLLYSQERIGRRGRRFRVHKFRTMVADADKLGADLATESRHPVWLLLDHDPRITAAGRFLRRTSIDELPQLWNVLRGDMSLVGPRPMPPSVHEHITGWGAQRLDLTPGLTGLWQVLGRTAIPFEEMVKLDYLYAANWSLWYDVRLLIRTLPAVVRGRGAN
ncbi:MAG: exopolysaccharide biosynthesis polyprenyl glycosylphosphotransferase [Solirubrobacteraceae bacterium]|nr:exopolysaccharide biosynthesis polyprenyl glycosylphosphotransferase [Solirubrobacteraceae bacterium]